MPGSGTLDSGGGPLQRDAAPIAVFSWDGESDPELVPNVVCDRVDYREGADPPTAHFHYLIDDVYAATYGWPRYFEELWPIDAQGPYVVSVDERLLVATLNPDGTADYLFDGFAQVPIVDAAGDRQRVELTALSVAQRCFDVPIYGSRRRDAGNATKTDGTADWDTGLPARFNPASDGPGARGGVIGNATPPLYETQPPSDDEDEPPPGDYPVFIDPTLNETQPTYVDQWDVPGVVEYLLSVEAPEQQWVAWPTFGTLATLLQAYYPPQGSQTLAQGAADPLDLTVRDYDASNKPLPDVLAEILNYVGILESWELGADDEGSPVTYLKLYRRDQFAAQQPKQLQLAAAGTPVDPSTTNTAAIHLARDCNRIVNAWAVDGGDDQVEVTVYLAPLFQPAAGDETAGVNTPTPTGRNKFFKSNFGPATPQSTLRAYRWFGADECGDGHWQAQSGQWVTGTPCDFAPAFPPEGSPPKRQYVQRYRPGSHRILSVDSAGRPVEAILEINTSAQSIDPFVGAIQWSAGGTWQRVTGGWDLLPDRLGIRVTVEDPDNWNGGKAVGDIRTVSWLQSGSSKTFALRLTTVIRADQGGADITADMRPASPTRYARERVVDARDHLRQGLITAGSTFYPNQVDVNGASGDGTNPLLVRDDTKLAKAHAAALRSAHEFPPLAGSAMLPGVDRYYRVGDLVSQISGRNASLQTNVGASQGEAPCYAWVVGVSYSFEGDRQQTTLQLSDRRAEVRNVPWGH